MSPKPPWSPQPEDDPVVREPQAKLPVRVIVAFFAGSADEHSAVSARDEAKLIAGNSASVRLMTATLKGRTDSIYVILAETRTPSSRTREMTRIAKKLHHAPFVDSVLLFNSSDAATRAVVKHVSHGRDIAAQYLHLDSFDR